MQSISQRTPDEIPQCCHAAGRLVQWKRALVLLLDAVEKTQPQALGESAEDLERAITVAQQLIASTGQRQYTARKE